MPIGGFSCGGEGEVNNFVYRGFFFLSFISQPLLFQAFHFFFLEPAEERVD